MLTSVVRLRGLFAGFTPRPVALSSPYPVDECLRRLAAVTTTRGTASWYLDARTALLPDPKFLGDIGPSLISVIAFGHGSKDSLVPRLEGRLEPAAAGGATLTGTIGLFKGVEVVMPRMCGLAAPLALTTLVAGVAMLVSGHINGLALVLFAVALSIIVAGFVATGLQSLQHGTPALIKEISKILGTPAD